MPLTDTKLRALYGKPYFGKTELSDRDGIVSSGHRARHHLVAISLSLARKSGETQNWTLSRP